MGVPRHTGASRKSHHGKALRNRYSEVPSDEEVIAKLKAGDDSLFNVLVHRYRRRIHQLALGLLRNEQDAQEVVQEAFLKAYLGLHGFRGASTFYTWLHRIVHNLAIDAKRQPYRKLIDWESIADRADDVRTLELPRVSNSDPFESLSRTELTQSLNVALSQLNGLHRTVIVMRELEGLSYREMAERLRISKGTVMSRLFHARRCLQYRLISEVTDGTCSG